MSVFSKEILARQRAEYHPCENGVHIFCGEQKEFGGYTVKNFPGATLDVFIKHSSADYNSDDFDLVCDLMEDGSIVKDCVIRRQDLAIIEREIGEGEP